ncbi:unnamed protein product, partial [Mesorhabditis belari]|uniref:tRNA (carboxymethyluridine(34)-5-O)-methyltransferase n=1 Tax=Mesorhabditis belari TaxID=2138241 RepID=A0AAF3FRK5_9BILA
MYFNENKPRQLGTTFSGDKLRRKLQKSVQQLKRHDADVIVSDTPTAKLFVANSSVLCGVSLEELEEIFVGYDAEAQITVFPNKRAYSFVEFSTLEKAKQAYDELHGYIHPALRSSHLPFLCAYVENLPAARPSSSLLRPNDLVVVEDFVTEIEEEKLLNFILQHAQCEVLKHRSVLHFGHEFDYSSNTSFKKCEPIPKEIDDLIKAVQRYGVTIEPDQITINIYEPGQGIPPHYDTHSAFEDPVISLSLLSDVVMEFKDGANSARTAGVLLPRRSLSLIQGESRYRWKHGIVNRKYDVNPLNGRVFSRRKRVSITMRKIRHKPCECAWKEFCDWDRDGEMSIPQNDSSARFIEQNYVSNVYEEIAPHFDETRHSQWKAVQGFLDSLPDYSLVYDVGCGNGKYLIAKDRLVKFGSDLSMNLCQIAARKDCQVARADGRAQPFRPIADAVLCIAVLHHLSSHSRRLEMVCELLRLLRPGGRACITVWSMDQTGAQYSKMRENKDDTEMNEQSKGGERLRVHDGKCFEQQDLLVPWQVEGGSTTDENKGKAFLRFYHVFRENELAELCLETEMCTIEKIICEQGNWIAIIQKV